MKKEKLWEADIKYTPEQLEWMKGNKENRQRRDLTNSIRRRWPNNVVNYVLSSDYSEYFDFLRPFKWLQVNQLVHRLSESNSTAKVYSEPWKPFKLELFVKTVNGFHIS